MVAEEGSCVLQPLHLPLSLCTILQGCHVPSMHTAQSPGAAPSVFSQPIILSAGSWEDWGALHGVRSCQCGSEDGAPSPRSMRAGRSGGPSLRFTLNPQNSPELEKCSILSIGAADRRLCSGLGEVGRGPGREGEQGSADPSLRFQGLT